MVLSKLLISMASLLSVLIYLPALLGSSSFDELIVRDFGCFLLPSFHFTTNGACQPRAMNMALMILIEFFLATTKGHIIIT